MILNLDQTKIVGLTMKLDLKAREYNQLCEKLEKYKAENISENDNRLYELHEEFQKNYEEICEIKQQLNTIKENEENVDKLNKEKYSTENLFKHKEIAVTSNNEILGPVAIKESFFSKIISKFKNILKK